MGLVLSQAQIARAQTVKDRAAVVFKISSIDNVLDSVAYMVGKAGFRNFVPAITLGAGAFLEGFDTERPIGGYLTLDDGVPKFVAFVPVEDLEDVIDMLENNGVEIEEDGDDYIIISPTGEEIVVRGKGKWAFISANAEMLDDLPADPAAVVAGISDDYMLGVKAYVQRIPADLRSQAIEWMEEAFEETYDNIPGPAAEFQRKMNENSLNQLADMIQQADEIFVGFATDKKGERLYADFSFTGKQGSDLAKNLTASKGATTEFAGFLKMENATATFNAAGKVSEHDAANAKATFGVVKDQIGTLISEDGNLSKEDAKLVEELVVEVVDLFVNTIDSGKMDMGGAAIIDDAGLTLVAGAHVVDADKITGVLKKVIDAKGDKLPPQVELKMNAETYKGIKFHTLSGEIPEEEARVILGETTTLVVGVGGDKAYVSFGADAVAKLKAAIDGKSSQKAEPLSQFNVKISPILKLASKFNDDAILSEMAKTLEDNGNEMIRVTGEIIENGQRSRFEIQDGILSLIQVAAQGFGGGGGGFGGDF